MKNEPRSNTRIALSACIVAGVVAFGSPAHALEPTYQPPVAASGKALLVLKDNEYPQLQTEFFAAFDRNNKSEKRNRFLTLPSDKQKKTLEYYNSAKTEQSDEKAVIKSVNNLMSYYINLKINEDALDVYKQTGKLPKTENVAVHALMVNQGCSTGYRYADLEKARQIDDLIMKILVSRMAELDKKSAQLEKNIKMLDTLLKAL